MIFIQVGGAPTSIYYFFCSSIHQSFVHHISETIHHLIIIFGAHVWNDDISRLFFYFFEILIFWAVREVKGQKIAQNDKTLCLLCFISHYPLWKGKKCSKMRKNYVCHAPYLKKRTSYDFHLWYTCVGWYLQAFHSFFQDFDFLGC